MNQRPGCGVDLPEGLERAAADGATVGDGQTRHRVARVSDNGSRAGGKVDLDQVAGGDFRVVQAKRVDQKVLV